MYIVKHFNNAFLCKYGVFSCVILYTYRGFTVLHVIKDDCNKFATLNSPKWLSVRAVYVSRVEYTYMRSFENVHKTLT